MDNTTNAGSMEDEPVDNNEDELENEDDDVEDDGDYDFDDEDDEGEGDDNDNDGEVEGEEGDEVVNEDGGFTLLLVDEGEEIDIGNFTLEQACATILESTNPRALLRAIYYLCNNSVGKWLNAETTKNRQYMSRTGTTKKIVELLSTDYLNLKEIALLCIWAYGETAETREELASYGVVPKVIELSKSKIQSIRLGAMGSLWGFLEYTDVQLDAVEQGVIPFLMSTNNTFSNREYDLRSQTTLVGCIFCCACNEACRPTLIEQGVPDFLFNVYANYDDSVSVKYFCGLCLALLTQDDASLGKLDRKRVLELITTFLQTHQPSAVAEVEEADSFAWKSLLPFFHLTQSKFMELRWLGIFCINHLSRRSCNIKIFEAEQFIPQLVCLGWDSHPPTRALALEAFTRLYPLTPPSLLDITRAKIRHFPSLYNKAALYELNAM